jgi:ADP-heptose:LPS heptosyltransferase
MLYWILHNFKMTYLTLYIYIDKILGSFFLKFIEVFFYIKKKIIKDKKIKIEYIDFQNIIITKFLGIGSISRSLNLISDLKNKYPNSEITFVTFLENKNFVKLIKPIDNYIFIEKNNIFYFFLNLIFLLYKNFSFNNNSLYIDLEAHSNFSKIISSFNNSIYKIGFYNKKKSSIFNQNIFYDRMLFIESNYNKILKFLDINAAFKENKLDLLNLQDSEISIKKKLHNININKKDKFFVININASDLCIERKWDSVNFEKLIARLIESKYKIILIGTKNELKNTKIINDKFLNFHNQIFNFSGLTSVGELISLFKNYNNVFITNDSGPLHLANISKCSTISLWGPGNPIHYAEKYSNHKILYKKVHCSPCIYIYTSPPCNGNNICMKQITVDDVYKESINLISEI